MHPANVPANLEVRSLPIPELIIGGNKKLGVVPGYAHTMVGLRGSGMVQFERALVSSYGPSILTFPLSLHVSEILSLLFSSMPLFPYPTCSLPKMYPCSPGNRWIAFWLQRAKVLD